MWIARSPLLPGTTHGNGLPGEPVCEMLIEAVEKRFGAVEPVPADHRLEFLTDNGGAYIATDTRAMARALGLLPVNTPVCSHAEQPRGRELRQHVQARLRGPYGPA